MGEKEKEKGQHEDKVMEQEKGAEAEAEVEERKGQVEVEVKVEVEEANMKTGHEAEESSQKLDEMGSKPAQAVEADATQNETAKDEQPEDPTHEVGESPT